MSRICLGLDPATTVGWGKLVELPTGEWEPIEWGTENFSPKGPEPEGVRFRRVADWIADGILDGVDLVALESSMTHNRRAAQILSGMTTAILIELERHELPYAFVAPSTLKKFATGFGGSAKRKVTKEMVRAELNGWGGITAETEMALDASDALTAARWLVETSLVEPAPALELDF